MACIFCAIVAQQSPAEVVFEDEVTALAVLRTVRRLVSTLRKAVSADGINLIHAAEQVVFQSVFHFHVHLILRWFGEDIRLPWRPAPGRPEEIRQAAQQIRAYIEC
jgi:histidine triad (HIT) family protein